MPFTVDDERLRTPAPNPIAPEGSPASEPSPQAADAPPPVLALALGLPRTVPLARELRETFPAAHLPNWDIQEAGASTDMVMAVCNTPDAQQWTTLLVTNYLVGQQPLASALYHVRHAHPDLRIAVLVDRDTEDNRKLIRAIAQFGIYNIFVGQPQPSDLVRLITETWTWHDSAASYLTADATPPPVEPINSSVSRPVAPPVATGDEPPLTRREVVVVSTTKPVLIAVAGIIPGAGTSNAVAGIAERVHLLGHPAVVTELNHTGMLDAYDGLHAERGEPNVSWQDLRARRRWSYIVVDCQVLWSNIPREADLVLFVGPGATTRWFRWDSWIRGLPAKQRQLPDPALVRYGVAPHPMADAVIQRLRGLPELQPSLVVAIPEWGTAPVDEAWDNLIAPVLPAGVSAPAKSRWGRGAPLLKKLKGGHPR